MSTFFSAFKSSTAAERAVQDVLLMGISPDDISVLVSDLVLKSDDLVDETPDMPSRDFIPESPIGGGIATTQPDDDISSIDESDDSQTLAEENSYPHVDQALIEQVNRDWEPPMRDANTTRESDSIDRRLQRQYMPGLGIALGGGELATAALAKTEKESMESIFNYLRDRGVSALEAEKLLETFNKGGAILSVELSHGVSQAANLEKLARHWQATFILTVGSPAY